MPAMKLKVPLDIDCKDHIEWLASRLKIERRTDWYRVTRKDLHSYGGTDLLADFGSLCTLLKFVYPQEEWLPWKFDGWETSCSTMEEKRRFFDWLGEEAMIMEVAEWEWMRVGHYIPTMKEFFLTVLGSVYPDTERWSRSLDALDDQIEFLARTAPCLEVKEEVWEMTPRSWYHVGQQELGMLRPLVERYGSWHHALRNVVAAIAPDHSKIEFASREWQTLQTLEHYPKRTSSMSEGDYDWEHIVDYLAHFMQVSTPEDWYHIPFRSLSANHAAACLLLHHRSLVLALNSIFAPFHWHPSRFTIWNDLEQQIDLLLFHSHALHIRSPEGWYQVLHGNWEGTLGCGPDLWNILETVFPDYPWLPWKFQGMNQEWLPCAQRFGRRYLDWVADIHGFDRHEPSHWYAWASQCGSDHSVARTLQVAYPELPWEPWRFLSWPELRYQQEVVESIAQQLEVDTTDAWYSVTKEYFGNAGGGELLEMYSSVYHTLESLYSEVSWQSWRFDHVDKGYWKDIGNQRKFFDWLAKERRVETVADWYALNRLSVQRCGGDAILALHGTVREALQAAYPTLRDHFQFHGRSRAYWEEPRHHRPYLDWVARQLSIRRPDDWYSVSEDAIARLGGADLLRLGSLGGILKATYPSFPWQLWRFGITEEAATEHRRWMACMEDALCIGNASDWYTIPQSRVSSQPNGRSLLAAYGGSLWNLLSYHETLAPDMDVHAKSELCFFRALRTLISPGVHVEHNATLAMLAYPSGKPMTFDVWIPHFNIVLEYQGHQHYENLNIWQGEQGTQVQYFQDNLKFSGCSQLAITLLKVPFWWNWDFTPFKNYFAALCNSDPT